MQAPTLGSQMESRSERGCSATADIDALFAERREESDDVPSLDEIDEVFSDIHQRLTTPPGRLVAGIESDDSWDLFDSPEAPPSKAPSAPEGRPRWRAALAVLFLLCCAAAVGAGAGAGAARRGPALEPPREAGTAARALEVARAPNTNITRTRERAVGAAARREACISPAPSSLRLAASGVVGGLAFFVGVPYVPGLFDNAVFGVLGTLLPLLDRSFAYACDEDPGFWSHLEAAHLFS